MRHSAQDRSILSTNKSGFDKSRDKKRREKSWVKMDELPIEQQDSKGSMGKDATMRQEEVGVVEERDGMGNGEGSANGPIQNEELGDGRSPHDASGRRRERRRSWLGRNGQSYSHAHFRVYKRRWFGLAQLVLLNVVVSWDVRVLLSASFFSFQGFFCRV